MIFRNRSHAGKLLSTKLIEYKNCDGLVLALPRGGVPVAAEIAKELNLPLDVLIVRKIGAPFQEELAVGALCEEEDPFWLESSLARAGLQPDDLALTLKSEKEKIKKQTLLFRAGKPFPTVTKKVVIVVDDGLATGATMASAIKFLKKKAPLKIVIAVPVAAESSSQQLMSKVNDVVTVESRDDLQSVGQWYRDFTQVEDQEVQALLNKNHQLSAEIKSSDPGSRDSMSDSMSGSMSEPTNLVDAIISKMTPFTVDRDLDKLIDRVKSARVVMLGEASHGTEEFYQLRSLISKRLISEHGFKFIAVEGDWPDAYRLHRYIQRGEGGTAANNLLRIHRWPTWMWANDATVKLAEWMRSHRAGFFGLDVYSLFESISEVLSFLKKNNSQLAHEFGQRYACFEPFEGDEISYAKSLIKFPKGCEHEVLLNLQKMLDLRMKSASENGDELFSSQQNARIIAKAEAYYRAMLAGDASSWNVRDSHMMDTLDRLLERYGEDAKAIVWAHNTHIGDYRATDMLANGYVNLGGLARQSYGNENVALVGFGTYQGQVLAGAAWGSPEQVMTLPAAQEKSYEHFFHQAAVKAQKSKYYLNFDKKDESFFLQKLGHRAVGVVYDPRAERRGNYVPTELSKRYDSFVFFDKTTALKSLHAVFVQGQFPETWPSGL